MSGGPDGPTVVVDLKTGKTDPESDSGVLEHAQLAAYQVAVQQGLIEGAPPESLAGARLVIVSKTLAKSDYRIAHQHTLDDESRSAFLRRVMRRGARHVGVELHGAGRVALRRHAAPRAPVPHPHRRRR